MNVYEDEIFEKKMDQITDQLGYLFLDMVLMSVKKINAENTILKPTFRTLSYKFPLFFWILIIPQAL